MINSFMNKVFVAAVLFTVVAVKPMNDPTANKIEQSKSVTMTK